MLSGAVLVWIENIICSLAKLWRVTLVFVCVEWRRRGRFIVWHLIRIFPFIIIDFPAASMFHSRKIPWVVHRELRWPNVSPVFDLKSLKEPYVINTSVLGIEDSGAEIREVSMCMDTSSSIFVYLILRQYEVSSNVSHRIGDRQFPRNWKKFHDNGFPRKKKFETK